MDFIRKYQESILASITASLLSIALLSLISLFLGESIGKVERLLFIVIGSIILAGLIFSVFDWRVKKSITPRVKEEIRSELEKGFREKEEVLEKGFREKEEVLEKGFREKEELLRKEIEKRAQDDLESKTGIIEIFSNFTECEEEVLNQIKESSSIRIFVQIGKKIFGGTTEFYDYLGGSELKQDAVVKILHASKMNPYLSEESAKRRQTSSDKVKVWSVDLEHARQKMALLSISSKAKVMSRQHREGYVWRFYIFDNYAYVQPYFYERKNDIQAPVLKLAKHVSSGEQRENPKSLYKVFSKYFDNKWKEYNPSAPDLTPEK